MRGHRRLRCSLLHRHRLSWLQPLLLLQRLHPQLHPHRHQRYRMRLQRQCLSQRPSCRPRQWVWRMPLRWMEPMWSSRMHPLLFASLRVSSVLIFIRLVGQVQSNGSRLTMSVAMSKELLLHQANRLLRAMAPL